MNWLDSIRALRSEIETGGDQSPCPFCCTPRVQRSDYIRCCRCAINWLPGEPLDHDPRDTRLKRFLASCAETAKPGKQKENEDQ